MSFPYGRILFAVLALALAAAAGGPAGALEAHAQAYPSKNLRIVISYPPGGISDLIFSAATLGQVYRSTDGGETWTALKRRLGEIRALAWLPD